MCSKKVYVKHNTCERRYVGYIKLIQYLQINKWNIVDNMDGADCILYFACGMKSEETILTITELEKSTKKIIVFGCAPQMLQISMSEHIIPVDLREEEQLDAIFDAEVPYKSINIYHEDVKNLGRGYVYEQAIGFWDPRLITPKCNDIYSLTISEGCSNNCSYCSIHNATGKLHSKSIDEIVSEMKNALKEGYKHFRLQCENSGSYGLDINTNLGDLLNAFGEIKEEFDIDLPDLHPEGFVRNFDSIIRYMRSKSIYLIHLPVQSGSQKILNAMNRNYDIKQVKEYLNILFDIYPKVKVGTDIIVGFPGETEDDFRESFDLLKSYNFSPIYVHGYCDKYGTQASKMKNKVEEDTKCERIKKVFCELGYVACYINNYREFDKI